MSKCDFRLICSFIRLRNKINTKLTLILLITVTKLRHYLDLFFEKKTKQQQQRKIGLKTEIDAGLYIVNKTKVRSFNEL